MTNGFVADEEPLPADFAEHAIELRRRIKAESARLDDLELAERGDQQRADEERAQRARSGKLGPEWRSVQNRIDLNQTTLEDVFSGADGTSAAETLRSMSRRNISKLRELWEKQDEAQEEPTPLDLISQARAVSATNLRGAAEHIDTVLAEVERRRL
jgi:hypothetical protein